METNTTHNISSSVVPVVATTPTIDPGNTPGSSVTEVESRGESPSTSGIPPEKAAILNLMRKYLSTDKHPWTLEASMDTLETEIDFVLEMVEGLHDGSFPLDGEADVRAYAGLLLKLSYTLRNEFQAMVRLIIHCTELLIEPE